MMGPEPVHRSARAGELLAEARKVFDRDRVQAVAQAQEALACARAEGDLPTQAQAQNLLSDAERMAGRLAAATELARSALAAAERAGDEATVAASLNSLGALAWHRGELDSAIGYVRRALGVRERLGDERGVASTCGNLSLLLTEKGDLLRAMEYQQRCLGLREKLGDSKGLGAAYLNLGVLYADLGDWDKALESYFRALAEKERAGDTANAALCYNNIGETYLFRGKLDRARFYLDRARQLAEQADARWVLAEVLGTMGETAFWAGDYATAHACYEQDRSICESGEEREEFAETLRRMAELALAEGDFAECRRLADEAQAICQKAGLRREEANVRRVRGELLGRTGTKDKGTTELAAAEEMLRGLGKNYELGRVLLSRGRLLEGAAAVTALSEALAIFENLGATGRAAEIRELLQGRPPETEQAGLLSSLAELAARNLGVTDFLGRALGMLAEYAGISAAAVFLRDGRVFESDGWKTEEGGRAATLPLEAGGRRLGTLIVRGALGTVPKPAADLLSLGLAQAGGMQAAVSMPAPEPGRFPGIIGAETSLRSVFETIERAAPTRANVLILGESGTGKELVARALHDLSDRKDGPFVAVNCAAIPEALLESELFGIEKGTATGVTGRTGRFEAANGGTLFLDEVGDMSPSLQAKTLRVLQERAFERVGGRETITVDVRVVAATNKNLQTASAEGRFRADLLYRLNVVSVVLPPLRERKADIPEMVNYFMGRVSREYGKSVRGVTDDCMSCLVGYEWPGNVRELENVLERGVILAQGELLASADLPPALQPRHAPEASWREVRRQVEDAAGAGVELKALMNALEATGWNVSRAAEKLGMSRRQCYRLMEKHGVRRRSKAEG